MISALLMTINAYTLIMLSTTLYNAVILSSIGCIIFVLIFSYLLRGKELSKISEIIICATVIITLNLVPLPLSYVTDFDGKNPYIGESLAIGWPAVTVKYYFVRGDFRVLTLDHFIINLVSLIIVVMIMFVYLEARREYKKV